MALLTDPLLKFNKFITNNDNKSYRSIRKLTPEEAGLTSSDISNLLRKINPKEKIDTVKTNVVKKIDNDSNSTKPLKKVENLQNLSSGNIENCQYSGILSHTETANLFRKINQLHIDVYNIKRKEKVMEWYKTRRYEINKLFKESMNFFIYEDLEFTMSYKALYDKFVEYCYDNYKRFHI
jgi:hypothetical protein